MLWDTLREMPFRLRSSPWPDFRNDLSLRARRNLFVTLDFLCCDCIQIGSASHQGEGELAGTSVSGSAHPAYAPPTARGVFCMLLPRAALALS